MARSALKKIDLYWQTLRHLKPGQYYQRVWHQVKFVRLDLKQAPKLRKQTGNWVKPASRIASMRGSDEFKFAGERGSISSIGWDGTQRSKLWRYN